MNSAIGMHKDEITILVACLGMAVTLVFGHFKNWRHRICFEYSSTKSAATTALRDSFQEQASKHFLEVQSHVQETGSTAQEFYSQPASGKYVKLLGLKVEKIQRLERYHSILLVASQCAEVALWLIVLTILAALAGLWWNWPHAMGVVELTIGLTSFFAAAASVCVLLYFEGLFVSATHKALKPEMD